MKMYSIIWQNYNPKGSNLIYHPPHCAEGNFFIVWRQRFIGRHSMKLEGLVHATVCFPLNNRGEALIGRKTRIIGIGLYNGPGGGIEKNESIDKATVREVREETGIKIDPRNLERRAVVYCHNYKKDGVTPFDCKLYVSVAPVWQGTPRPSDEFIDLRWVAPRDLPVNEMMAGDRGTQSRVLVGDTLVAEVWYAPGMKNLAKQARIEPRTPEELNRSWVIP